MTKLSILLLCWVPLGLLHAQEFVQVSMGTGYSQQAYYRLADDNTHTVANASWDLAFTAIGSIDAGIAINESTTAVMGAPAPELQVFLTAASSFATVIDTGLFVERLYNGKGSWDAGAALNTVANAGNPFDFGWGIYNPTNHSLLGNRVFAIRLRNNSYKKFMVESYAGGTYTIKYADFDGSNEQVRTISKGGHTAAQLALFSFTTGEVLTALPAWDLLFCRYYTRLDDGTGNLLNYVVTGVLSAPGVQAVKASGIDPATVSFADHEAALSGTLDVIGHDWKSFSFTSGWVIPQDLAYFVKTADDRVYKLTFIDFEGSSTGVSTFEKVDLGVISDVATPSSNVAQAAIYPNPARQGQPATLAFTLKQRRDQLPLAIRDLHGRLVWQAQVQGNAELNVVPLPDLGLPAGLYIVSIGTGIEATTLKIMQH